MAKMNLILLKAKALKYERAMLTIHGEEKKVHWAGCGDCEAGDVSHKPTEVHFCSLLRLWCLMA